MMQYNILCTVKRFEAYETIGGLFAEVTNDTLELSVTDKIWAIILDFVLEAAERYSIDATELLADFIESNPVAHTLRNMYIYKQASWYLFTCETLAINTFFIAFLYKIRLCICHKQIVADGLYEMI